MPEEMVGRQLPYLSGKNFRICRQHQQLMSNSGFEADDIIGTLATMASKEELDVYIVSGDKDFMQLVNDKIFLYAPSGRQAEIKIYDRNGVVDKWGVPPEKIIDPPWLDGRPFDIVSGVQV